MTSLYTIGYQGASVAEVIDALKDAGIALLIDVRAAPVSRKPGFSRRELAASLETAGLRYRHFGHLGNPKAGRDAARAGRTQEYRQIFQRHLETPQAQDALVTVAGLAERESACLMCFERDPHHCHRLIVASRLAEQGAFEITHLFAGPPELPLLSG